MIYGPDDEASRQFREQKRLRAREKLSQIEIEHPLKCEFCGTAIPAADPQRELIVDDLVAYGRRTRRLACSECTRKNELQKEARRRREEEYQRQEAERRRQACVSRIQPHLSFYLTTRGVPASLCDARLDECPDLSPQAVEMSCNWAGQPEGFLLLTGPPGAGKSYLAAAILARIVTDGPYVPSACCFIEEARWVDSLRNEYGCIHIEQRPYKKEFLVYDDLGASHVNDIRRAEIEKLIRTRHSRRCPTVFTSNLSLQEIADKFGGRVASVLQEGRQVMKFAATDLRLVGSIRTRPDRPERPEGFDEWLRD